MSNTIVEKLFEERNNLWEQMKELNDREIKEERSLDASEKEQWDKMNDRMSEIDARTQELASVEEEKASELESQDDEIKRLEKEVEDEKIITQNILESKREIKNIFENFNDSNLISKLPSDNMDKTLLGLQAMLVEYTELRNALKSSKTYNLMKKLDKIRGK